MAHDTDEDEEDLEEAKKPARRSGPRFGPFVTIAAAILMLFGAVSRFGKTSEAGLWPNFDSLAANYMGKSRPTALPQDSAGTTTVTIGTLPPAPPAAAPQSQPQRGMRLDMRALPPPRGDFDLNEYQEQQQQQRYDMPPLSIPGPAPLENNDAPARRFDPLPEAAPLSPDQRNTKTYTVANGDNWVKIGKVTGKRWQDIQSANPDSRNGLRVGMKLTLP